MEGTKEVKILVADPSALGLFGLAVITLVASSQKLGLTSGVSLVLPWAIFLGATAQLFACINDFKHNNTFGATAFGAYAFFWYAMGMTWLIQNGVFGEKLALSADSKQLGFAFLAYLIFTIFMTIGAMETETEKIGFRQPYNYRYIQKLRSVRSSLLNLMLNYQCWI